MVKKLFIFLINTNFTTKLYFLFNIYPTGARRPVGW